jgi:bacteriorhodopsin
MKNKLSKALEIIWLVTSLICIITGIHQTIYEGISKSYLFFIFSFVAFVMYLLRKQIRKSNKSESTNG